MKKFYKKVRGRHDAAYWAGAVTFLTSMLSMGAINKYDLHAYEEFIAALLVSVGAAGTVYARQRLYQAERSGDKVDPRLTDELCDDETKG